MYKLFEMENSKKEKFKWLCAQRKYENGIALYYICCMQMKSFTTHNFVYQSVDYINEQTNAFFCILNNI